MDTDVVEQSGQEPGTPEATIDEVDRLLDGVEAALTRLDEGTYGACHQCGRPIDDARLAEQPTALACAACESGGPDTDPGDGAQHWHGEEVADPGDDWGAADVDVQPAPSPWAVRAFPEV